MVVPHRSPDGCERRRMVAEPFLGSDGKHTHIIKISKKSWKRAFL
jgi:hypothetical protein